MAECPSCKARLVKQITPIGVIYSCPSCKGRAVALTVARRAGATEEAVREIWGGSSRPDTPHVRLCPHCSRQMAQVTIPTAGAPLTLDLCRMCASIWFDKNELGQLPKTPPPPAPKPEPLHVRQQAAILKAQAAMARAENDPHSPDETWQWVPGLLGLPVECNAPKLQHLPWATWWVALTCCVASLLALLKSPPECEALLKQYGFTPAQWDAMGGVTLLTSFFLHGGWVHLASNMYFLVIFGDNVEDRMGIGRFLLLLLGGHLAGALLHGALDPRSSLPLVGASAGISAVIACYAIAFPKVRLAFLFWRWSWIYWLRMPAIAALVLFVLLQIIGAALQLGGFSKVSALGHLGGLAVGGAAGVWSHFAQARERSKALGGVYPAGR